MTYFDANTWIGRWPFSFAPSFTAATLRSHLQRHGIGRALVSPLDAVFQPEPGPANRALLRATRTMPTLLPVPVINPALPQWREELETCAADQRVRAVRILPNYHHFSLQSAAVVELLAAVAARRLRLIISVRLVDERHEYFALRIKGVPMPQLETFLVRNPDLPVLMSGLTRVELMQLTAKHPQLLADLSFAEWDNTIEHLLTRSRADQLVFATHTPFLITKAATAKLELSPVKLATRTQIAVRNLERFFQRGR